MPLTTQEIYQIATRTADQVMERMRRQREERELGDHIIGSAMGPGAIPLYGRETRKEPCHGCRIDPSRPLEPGNVMATTEGAIGILSAEELRDWCSEIIEVKDGRCGRARGIREAAKRCKELHPTDTAKFFECYAPAWAATAKGSAGSHHSNPGHHSKEYKLFAIQPKEFGLEPGDRVAIDGLGLLTNTGTVLEAHWYDDAGWQIELTWDNGLGYGYYKQLFDGGTVRKLTGQSPNPGGKKPTRDDVRVEVWEERDRLHIGIQDKETGDYITSWWDEEARQMFVDGFFKARLPGRLSERDPVLVESVLSYAEHLGLLEA